MVTTTPEGIGFLVVGTGVGAFISFVLFCTTVVAHPAAARPRDRPHHRHHHSFKAVFQNLVPMIGFGIIIVALTFAALLPMFLGLLVVLPVLGHATWHLYKAVVAPEG